MFSASHARDRKLEGGIQKVFQRALAAAAQHGDRVINASIGMALDDRGKLFTSAVLMEELRGLSPEEVCAYSPIAGIPDFLTGTTKLFLSDACRPLPKEQCPTGGMFLDLAGFDRLACPVATVGGSSALSLVLNNYVEKGASFLTSNYFWGPYETIAEARGVRMTTFELFDESGAFNAAAFEDGLRRLPGEVAMVLLNDPAQNPTGFCMSEADWDRVGDLLDREAARRRVVLLLDAAYLGYYRSFEEDRRVITRLLARPFHENLLLIVAGSCSKAFLSYGLRLGTSIAVHRDRKVLNEFFDCLEFNIRGEYSNIARGAMSAVGNICNDPAKMARHLDQVAVVRTALADRHRIWLERSNGLGLQTTPYQAGYFFVILDPRAEETTRLLEKELVFAVPMREGVRLAICSVPAQKLAALPQLIAEKMSVGAGA